MMPYQKKLPMKYFTLILIISMASSTLSDLFLLTEEVAISKLIIIIIEIIR